LDMCILGTIRYPQELAVEQATAVYTTASINAKGPRPRI
jgi:hypothetical protein